MDTGLRKLDHSVSLIPIWILVRPLIMALFVQEQKWKIVERCGFKGGILGAVQPVNRCDGVCCVVGCGWHGVLYSMLTDAQTGPCS